ncbi:trehalose-phosphatase [Yanghanlia caeni]|uniref:Trehalose 6-phosphate phosphatase n=1 Tax=Yanghanlia caeni TaxID=3064283 RepID=A0ABU1D703_9BURK|nr:trehalose-phosphatase [Alcaligenaceae bacterium LG-2]
MYYKNMSEPSACTFVAPPSGKRITAPPCRLRLPPERLALFLDVDGTLAPITARPEFTRVPVDTRRILRRLQASGVALAALSGRPLVQVRRLLLPLDVPIAGSHGAQLRFSAGRSIRSTAHLPPGAAAWLQNGVAQLPDVWLERKPSALAIHWRQAPHMQSEVAALAARFLERAPGWQLICGHCVHELRAVGRHKGVALRRLMRQAPFAGRWPLAIGDDRTDEDAFAAALELGGAAIRVGPAANTCAPWAVADTTALARWLGALLAPD